VPRFFRNGHEPQIVVPGGDWKGMRLSDGGTWALMGITMAPGFDRADFALGDRGGLVREYSEFGERIRARTPA
jgi:hypothetical protein